MTPGRWHPQVGLWTDAVQNSRFTSSNSFKVKAAQSLSCDCMVTAAGQVVGSTPVLAGTLLC